MSANTEPVSVNGQSEDLQTLLKEMTTLREESRLERSRNADTDRKFSRSNHTHSVLAYRPNAVSC